MTNEMILWIICFVMFLLNVWHKFESLNGDSDMTVQIILGQGLVVSILAYYDMILGFQVMFVTVSSWWAVNLGLGRREFGMEDEEQ